MATGLRRIDNATRTVRTLDYRYPYVLFEYSSGDLVYMGVHYTHGSATSDEGWEVTKFTESADGVTMMETLDGAWDSRATMSWV